MNYPSSSRPLFLFESDVARVNDTPHPQTVLASSTFTGAAAAPRSSSASSQRRLFEGTQTRSPAHLASFLPKLVNRWQSALSLTDKLTEEGNAPSPHVKWAAETETASASRRSIPRSGVVGGARSLRSLALIRGQVANGRRQRGRRIVMPCINRVSHAPCNLR